MLGRLAVKLRGPQPKPKRLRGPRRIDPGVEVGDVLRLHDEERTLSVLFAVIDMDHRNPARPYPLVLGLYGEEPLATAPYLSDLDFSAFEGDDPPEHMCLAVPAMQWIITSAGDRLADVGEIAARGVRRPAGLGHARGSMTSWGGLRATYCNAHVQRMLRGVTERRIERYGPGDEAARLEYDARVREHQEQLRHAGPLLDIWRKYLAQD